MIATRTNQKRCGLDIGGTQIKAVLLDDQDTIIGEFSTPSNANLGPEQVKSAVHTLIKQIIQEGHFLTHIGIGCAGSVNPDLGIVRNSPNFSNWKNVNLRDWLKALLPVNVCVDNDANCAVLAEWKLGKGRGFKNVLMLTLGTGVGGGLILDGKLYRGSTGTGGELGHFSINSNGESCPCGNIGCFERYCSASAMRLRIPHFSAKQVFEKVDRDENCRSVVNDFLRNLKVGLVSLGNMFDPDVILLGGAVSQGLRPYLAEIQSWVKERSFPAVGEHMMIDFTYFSNNSGAIGAALLHEMRDLN